jgi:NDP-sugar pyrophosphorylase family protein
VPTPAIQKLRNHLPPSDCLFRYAHVLFDVLLDHVMQVVRHGQNLALLALEQLKLLEEGVGDVRNHAAKSFLSAHGDH